MSTRPGRRAWAAAACLGWLVCATAAANPGDPSGGIATAGAQSSAAANVAGSTAASVATTAGAAASAAEDIRDIRGPRQERSAWQLPALLAGVALLAAVLYAALKWRRRSDGPTPLLPHELALERLDAIRAQMPALGANAFAAAASDVIRGYIELRFDVTATRRTTEEFLGSLLKSPVSALVEQRALLQEFLRRCDYAKFAGAAGELESVEGLYQNARTFIGATAPRAA